MKFLSVLFVMVCISGNIMGQDRPAKHIHQTRSEVMAKNGMIATSQPLASAAGLQVLKDGGNAIDAAVTAAIVLSVVEPMMTGPGGDLFALVWSADDEKLYGLNASGPAGSKASIDYFRKKNMSEIPVHGIESVSVPGAVDGWIKLLERFGTIGLKQALQPAITYASDGFPVSPIIAADWQSQVSKLQKNESTRATYLIDNSAPQKGQMFRNPSLANTYRTLAENQDSFYEGEIAEKIAGYIQNKGGFVTLEDLKNFEAEWIEPISTDYRGYTVYELPPNGQGIAALQMLNILEGFNISDYSHNSGDYLHLLIEAKKLAYADLYHLVADPAFASVPVDSLLSKSYAQTRRERIDLSATAQSISPGISWSGDTIYLTVADKDGNMISLINSIFYQFGSGFVAGDTGVLLQNRGALFSLNPDHPNSLSPGKRPFHTIIPAMVFKDETPWLSFGVMGGPMQPQGHVQVLLNLIDFEMNLQLAGESPRFYHNNGAVSLETEIAGEASRILMQKGHELVSSTGVFGGFQGILCDSETGTYIGASDPRKDGLAIGY